MGYDVRLACMDSYSITDLSKERLVLMVASTFGAGDPPDNGEGFWQALQDNALNTISTLKRNWRPCKKNGLLTRLDTAFSRDQAEKIYVQDRMLEHGAELWAWLQEGAHFYICGDASRMAKEVESMLKRIIQQHGGMWSAEAEAYVKEMAKSKRYARDVY
nr:flavodoxin domain-containing protein [Ectobacillus funiculus]